MSSTISKKINKTALDTFQKIMGVLLLALATQFIIDGIKGVGFVN